MQRKNSVNSCYPMLKGGGQKSEAGKKQNKIYVLSWFTRCVMAVRAELRSCDDCIQFWLTDYKDDMATKQLLMEKMALSVCFKCRPSKEKLLQYYQTQDTQFINLNFLNLDCQFKLPVYSSSFCLIFNQQFFYLLASNYILYSEVLTY